MLNDITPILEQFGGIVVIDEAYIDFAESPSWIEKINEYPNLIVSQTFSKAWGQAALRVGVAYAQKGIIGLMNKVKPPYNISLPNQQNALHALDNIALFETQKATILAQRTWLQNALRELKIVKKIYPSDANFLLIETENADAVYEYLVTKKVVVRNRHKVIPNCLRITVGSETENQRLVAALENVPNPKGQGY